MRPRIAKFPRPVSSSRLIVGPPSESTCSLVLPVYGKLFDLASLIHQRDDWNNKPVTNRNSEMCVCWDIFFWDLVFFRTRWNIGSCSRRFPGCWGMRPKNSGIDVLQSAGTNETSFACVDRIRASCPWYADTRMFEKEFFHSISSRYLLCTPVCTFSHGFCRSAFITCCGQRRLP